MNATHSISALVRQFVFLAVIGAAFLFLIGPAIVVVAFVFSIVLMVVSFVLPFALIGVLVWVPLRLMRDGPRGLEGRAPGRLYDWRRCGRTAGP